MRNSISALAIFMTGFFLMGTANAQDGWIIKDSKFSVKITADKLEAVIENAPPKLFARIDHAQGARSIEMELEDATVIIFGAPQIGTPIMQENILAGIDLPIKVLIWRDEASEVTKIGYLDPATLKARYNIEGAEKSFEQMAGALNKFTDLASQ